MLDPAVEQINEYSPIMVSWNQRKTWRKVTNLVFDYRFQMLRSRNRLALGQHGRPPIPVLIRFHWNWPKDPFLWCSRRILVKTARLGFSAPQSHPSHERGTGHKTGELYSLAYAERARRQRRAGDHCSGDNSAFDHRVASGGSTLAAAGRYWTCDRS